MELHLVYTSASKSCLDFKVHQVLKFHCVWALLSSNSTVQLVCNLCAIFSAGQCLPGSPSLTGMCLASIAESRLFFNIPHSSTLSSISFYWQSARIRWSVQQRFRSETKALTESSTCAARSYVCDAIRSIFQSPIIHRFLVAFQQQFWAMTLFLSLGAR